MGIVEGTVPLDAATAARVQEELRAQGLDGWLLYDFHGHNPVSGGLLGLPAMTRRWFALIPADGAPVALTHRIEQQPWTGWLGEKRVYLAWRELEAQLAVLLHGRRRVALEYAPGNAIPYVDRMPGGLLELVRAAGVEPVSSADLISAFYARWSAEGEASHERAAVALYEITQAAFRHVAERVRAGETLTEWQLRRWIREQMLSRGLNVGGDTDVAVNANAANPHYAATAEQSSPIREGDLLLIDLWGKETADSIYADQTWMAYVGTQVPERLATLFAAVRDARDAAVALIQQHWAAGQPVHGYEADDAARAVITERGYGEAFIHRTGHSMDRELHGSGPNLDNLETRDTRRLIAGVGFSVEPGIYLDGDVGFRSEINVFMAPAGPRVTTPHPQRELEGIL